MRIVFDDVHAFGSAHQEKKLGCQAVMGGVGVKLHEEGVVFGVFRQRQRAEMFCKAAAQGVFPAADGAFDDNITVVHGLMDDFVLIFWKGGILSDRRSLPKPAAVLLERSSEKGNFQAISLFRRPLKPSCFKYKL